MGFALIVKNCKTQPPQKANGATSGANTKLVSGLGEGMKGFVCSSRHGEKLFRNVNEKMDCMIVKMKEASRIIFIVDHLLSRPWLWQHPPQSTVEGGKLHWMDVASGAQGARLGFSGSTFDALAHALSRSLDSSAACAERETHPPARLFP
jgi:hypothetical protein